MSVIGTYIVNVMSILNQHNHTMHNKLESISQFENRVINSQVPVVVEFGADWCGTCQILSASIKPILANYEGKINYYQVDFEETKEIVHNCGVTYLPTYIFFNRGIMVDSFKGALSREAIAKKFKDLVNNNQS